jgi:hypothetical protein
VANSVQFDPDAIFGVLERHRVDYVLIGGLAAVLHGAIHTTNDADITPSREAQNLVRLAAAMVELEARIRTDTVPEVFPFDCSPALLRGVALLNLVTKYGDLDISFEPAGTRGYPDLRSNAVELTIHGNRVVLAALADVIRSKEAANREKDRIALPALRKLAEMLRARG